MDVQIETTGNGVRIGGRTADGQAGVDVTMQRGHNGNDHSIQVEGAFSKGSTTAAVRLQHRISNGALLRAAEKVVGKVSDMRRGSNLVAGPRHTPQGDWCRTIGSQPAVIFGRI